MWKFKPKYPQSYWWERRQLGQQESREAEEMDENGNYWRVWNHKHERRKKKTGGRSETQETWDQHRRQANQIPRMTVKGSLRIPAVKRV